MTKETDYSRIFGVTITGGGETIVMDNTDIYQLYFIEDIYSWLKVGKMILKDTRGIAEFLPLVGDEKITITYASWVVAGESGEGEREEKEYTFDIFKVADIEDIGFETAGARERMTMSGVQIFFVETQHHKLHSAFYSRSWIDMKYHDIIMELAEDYVGIPSWVINEPADEYIEYFHTGLKTPADSIRWLMERIKGDISGQSGYLLYSNTAQTENSFNFVTLEYLLQNGPLIPPGDGLYTMGGRNQGYVNHMRNIAISCVDQTSCDKLIRCNMLGYDIYRKYQIKREYTYDESQAKYTTLGAYTLFNGSDLSGKILKPQEILTGESGDKYMKLECLLDNMYYSDWVKQYNLQQLISINVRGDVRRYAGAQLEINWLSSNTDVMFNENYMGRYLIKSITHQFSGNTRPQYNQKMVLIKNGYWNSQSNLTAAGKPKTDKNDESAAKGAPVIKTDGQGNVRGL